MACRTKDELRKESDKIMEDLLNDLRAAYKKAWRGVYDQGAGQGAVGLIFPCDVSWSLQNGIQISLGCQFLLAEAAGDEPPY